MKKYLYLLFAGITLTSCGSSEEKKENTESPADSTATEAYKAGDEISEDGAMLGPDFLKAMEGKDSMEVKLTAKINSVCTVKGCWMRLDMGNDQEVFVKFKDYKFFVPKDANGKTATIQGWAKVDTVSVADLRHYAEDEGKSKEEIEAITEPKAELSFMANGVLIK